jgi:hypothetical protein
VNTHLKDGETLWLGGYGGQYWTGYGATRFDLLSRSGGQPTLRTVATP